MSDIVHSQQTSTAVIKSSAKHANLPGNTDSTQLTNRFSSISSVSDDLPDVDKSFNNVLTEARADANTERDSNKTGRRVTNKTTDENGNSLPFSDEETTSPAMKTANNFLQQPIPQSIKKPIEQPAQTLEKLSIQQPDSSLDQDLKTGLLNGNTKNPINKHDINPSSNKIISPLNNEMTKSGDVNVENRIDKAKSDAPPIVPLNIAVTRFYSNAQVSTPVSAKVNADLPSVTGTTLGESSEYLSTTKSGAVSDLTENVSIERQQGGLAQDAKMTTVGNNLLVDTETKPASTQLVNGDGALINSKLTTNEKIPNVQSSVLEAKANSHSNNRSSNLNNRLNQGNVSVENTIQNVLNNTAQPTQAVSSSSEKVIDNTVTTVTTKLQESVALSRLSDEVLAQLKHSNKMGSAEQNPYVNNTTVTASADYLASSRSGSQVNGAVILDSGSDLTRSDVVRAELVRTDILTSGAIRPELAGAAPSMSAANTVMSNLSDAPPLTSVHASTPLLVSVPSSGDAAITAPGLQQPTVTMTASGAMMQSAISEAFGRPNWSEGMAKQVMLMVDQNINRAEIRLNPANLGAIEVRIEMNDDQINVAMNSRHGAVRDAMEQALPRLRDMFEQNGLTLADTDISEHSFTEQKQQQQDTVNMAQLTTMSRNNSSEVDVEQHHVVTQSLSSNMVDYYT